MGITRRFHLWHVAVLGFMLFSLIALVPLPVNAATSIPQSELNGAWYLNFCNEGATGCVSMLTNTTYISHAKDCNGNRVVYQGLPTNPVENQFYYGTATAAFGVNGSCVSYLTTKNFRYKFWRQGTDYRWVEIYEVGSQYTSLWRHRIGSTIPTVCIQPTVNRTFAGSRDAIPLTKVFTLSFTNLNYCYNGSQVWFQDNPEARLYVDSTLATTLQGACAGSSKTDTNNKLSSIYMTCNAVFSNKGPRPIYAYAVGDSSSGPSAFTIPGYLNATLNLGSAGSIGTSPPADQYRYYTLRIYNDGCYNVSGVNDNRKYCP